MDQWMEHLKNYGLLELHQEAQQVGYRIRVATGLTFDLEYTGGLDKYYQKGLGVKTFDDSEAGRVAAREFLGSVRVDVSIAQGHLNDETFYSVLNHYAPNFTKTSIAPGSPEISAAYCAYYLRTYMGCQPSGVAASMIEQAQRCDLTYPEQAKAYREFVKMLIAWNEE